MKAGFSFVAYGLAALLAFAAAAQTDSKQPAAVYTLIDGSLIVDDCPVCDRVPIVLPLRGTFEVTLVNENPLYYTFAIGNMSLTAQGNGFAYKVTGGGTYVFGGELALLQHLDLEVVIDNGISPTLCHLTNAPGTVTRPWPMLQVAADQTNGTLVQQYRLELNAAPFREIWFSTVKGFAAGAWEPPTNAISAGDMLSAAGRIVKRNNEHTADLGIQPVVLDLGLKDFDILPGAEIAFSIEQDVFSEFLGPLGQGDLLSQKGRVLFRNADLVAKFIPQPPFPPDIGLAAVHMMPDASLFFSVQTEFFSESLGVTIRPGDLVSSEGKVIRTGRELLAKFNPAVPDPDYGLAAVFLWPTNPISGVGEIWFSTRERFSDKQGQFYAAGDLLSDQGYVVFRNSELVSRFAPTLQGEFGLDGLFVVTDLTAVGAGTASLSNPILTNVPPGSVFLTWSGSGRVFQLQKAAKIDGPFAPVSPIVPDETFRDSGALLNSTEGFYRLRHW
jgi:hypothetical protein